MGKVFEAVLLVSIDHRNHTVNFVYPPNKSNAEMVIQAPKFCFPEQQSFRTSILLLKFVKTKKQNPINTYNK